MYFNSVFSTQKCETLVWKTIMTKAAAKTFQVHFSLFGQENYVFKREFMYV